MSLWTTPGKHSMGIDPQTFNRYSYVQNEPVNLIDPNDLCALRIGIVSNNLLMDDQLNVMKNEISRIFGAAHVEVEFVSKMPHYWLNINASAKGYTDKHL